MKKIAIAAMLCAATLVFTSCDNRPNVVGNWEGTMQQTIDGRPTDMASVLSFGRDGKASLTHLFTINVPGADSSITVSGVATIDGVWQYVQREDDEIVVSFDTSSINVNLDAEDVSISAITAPDTLAQHADNIKPLIAAQYRHAIEDAMRLQTKNLHLDDVEVRKPVLKFEISDVDYIFHSVDRQ